MAGLVLLSMIVTMVALFGRSVMRREREADAFAAEVVGPIRAADALAWLIEWRGKGWSPGLRKRWDAINALAHRAPAGSSTREVQLRGLQE